MHPEKSIWAKFNQEGAEFAERRKADLLTFLKKLVNHSYLHRTIEFQKFLLDQHAYYDYKNSKPTKDDGIIDKVTKTVYQSLPGRRRNGLSEPTSEDTAIQNFDYYLERMEQIIQETLQGLRVYSDLKRKQSSAILNTANLILKILNTNIANQSKPALLDTERLSETEDYNNKKLLADVEPQLKVKRHSYFDH